MSPDRRRSRRTHGFPYTTAGSICWHGLIPPRRRPGEKVRDFANNLMDIGANATAGATNEDADQAKRLKNADADNTAITELCK